LAVQVYKNKDIMIAKQQLMIIKQKGKDSNNHARNDLGPVPVIRLK
jgi:hypothetical protein